MKQRIKLILILFMSIVLISIIYYSFLQSEKCEMCGDDNKIYRYKLKYTDIYIDLPPKSYFIEECCQTSAKFNSLLNKDDLDKEIEKMKLDVSKKFPNIDINFKTEDNTTFTTFYIIY